MLSAYKYVITAIMLSEASFYADRLQLPVKLPLQASEVRIQGIGKPTRPLGPGGAIDTGRYFFGFGTQARFMVKLHPFGNMSMAKENLLLSRGTSLIDTNGAYQLATNWLHAIQVDVGELEKTNHAEVRQRWYYSAHGITKLPVFELRWGVWDDPQIDVSIDGRTKEMVYIRQENDGFSRRPEELIRNLDKLLEIPDEEFEKYSASERSNLVAQYATVDYRHPAEVPSSISHRHDVTNNYDLIDEKYSGKGKIIELLKQSRPSEK
jgi:hypothetical protein